MKHYHVTHFKFQVNPAKTASVSLKVYLYQVSFFLPKFERFGQIHELATQLFLINLITPMGDIALFT